MLIWYFFFCSCGLYRASSADDSEPTVTKKTKTFAVEEEREPVSEEITPTKTSVNEVEVTNESEITSNRNQAVKEVDSGDESDSLPTAMSSSAAKELALHALQQENEARKA